MAINMHPEAGNQGYGFAVTEDQYSITVNLDVPHSELQHVHLGHGESPGYTLEEAQKKAEWMMLTGVWHYETLYAPRLIRSIQLFKKSA
jgi:hypothetical protein